MFASPLEADPGSERVLLQVEQPARNHNGGMLQFTPEGTLLLGLGDGGGAGDRFGNGQNPDTLLAGLVEITVDGDPNPVKYATGLRNPWRFWIDGDLIYVADVGQRAFEEVDVAQLGPDLNYGWPIAEGLHCFRSETCDTTGQVIPVLEVQHGDGGACSITGGVVYRGSLIPEMDGVYLYSDYCGGWLRSFRYSEGAAVDQTDWTEQVGVPGQVTGFGVDGADEVYVSTIERVFALVPVR
jgi:glucose/arabinose dehydrogenase